MIEYDELPEFRRDFRKLKKRYRSLPEDLKTAKQAAIQLYHEEGIDNQAVFEITGLHGKEPVYKQRKFACKALRGKGAGSGIRIIYAYNESSSKVTFVEIYHKGDKENEDRMRILDYLKSLEET